MAKMMVMTGTTQLTTMLGLAWITRMNRMNNNEMTWMAEMTGITL